MQRHYVLPVSGVWMGLITLAAIGAWFGAHRLKGRMTTRSLAAISLVMRIAAGFLAMLAGWQFLQHFLTLTTNWPIWTFALAGALLVEVLIGLYALDRRTVPRRAGMALLGSRVALCLLVIAMLAQPVRSLELRRETRRCVALLVDDSASMHVADTQMSDSGKLRLAEMLSIKGVRRPFRLERMRSELEADRRKLSAVGDWLALLGRAKLDSRRKQLADRRAELHKSFKDAVDHLEKNIRILSEAILGVKLKLDPRTKNALRSLRAKLSLQVRDRLKTDALELTGKRMADNLARLQPRLLRAVRKSAVALGEVTGRLDQAAIKLDEAYFASLPDDDRKAVDAIAGRSRASLAREALLLRRITNFAKNETSESLLDRLRDKYDVKLYKFDAGADETDVDTWSKGSPRPPDSVPAGAQAPCRMTDIAAALRKVRTSIPPDQLAGVIVVSDGRHNAPSNPAIPARQLGMQKTPVCSILVGSPRPPRDAAVVALEAPETVYVKDRMYVTADLKLDGLKGENVRVSLFNGEKPVDFKNIPVPSGSYRYRVRLADEPKSSGLCSYRVEVQKFDGEVFADNNSYALTVSVTDDRTRLLIIEDRPRWEFRYLKNLFAGRDRTVRLQYVLLEPDRIAGAPQPTKICASATRLLSQTQATDLPADESEWMKFDVIILGDVNPDHLGPAGIEALRKFVSDRGGSLIVIAGANFMPNAYAGTPLEEMLPVVFSPASGRNVAPPEASFRIAMTPAGRQSVIMAQSIDADENERIWNSIPDIRRRYPIRDTKPGATVLAYALPAVKPDFLKASETSTDDEKIAEKRRRFYRTHALIAWQNVAMGRVLMLNFDRTWRMRYRVGDKYHHRLWGQVLRWATAGKLPAGTDFVKLGTDRSRYAPRRTIRVRAKIVNPDLTGVISKDVAVNVFAAGRQVLRKKMQYVPDSPGLYQVELGPLPGGTYRAELVSPEAKRILALDKVDKISVEFSVDPSAPTEQVDLAADRGLLGKLASLSGGVVVSPQQAFGVLKVLGKRKLVNSEPQSFALWDSWILLVAMFGVVTFEWILRKKTGLA